jgi:hypothetical protein
VHETKLKDREIEIILVNKKDSENTMPDGELVIVGYVSVVYVCRVMTLCTRVDVYEHFRGT